MRQMSHRGLGRTMTLQTDSLRHPPDLSTATVGKFSSRWSLATAYADLRTALSTSVLPNDQIAPGTLWLEAITVSNAVSIQLQSSSVMVKGGDSFIVWLPWAETCVKIGTA